jgi:hypothetical protein
VSERLKELLKAATISAIGLDVIIACEDYEIRNAIMDQLDATPEGAHVDRSDRPARS